MLNSNTQESPKCGIRKICIYESQKDIYKVSFGRHYAKKSARIILIFMPLGYFTNKINVMLNKDFSLRSK